jgi:hypothetical protein
MAPLGTARAEVKGTADLPAFLVAGGLIGLLGVVLFGAAHAVVIVPIWSRLFGGVPFGLSAGVAMGWALFELRAAGRFTSAPLSGLGFGVLLSVTLLPMTTVSVLLRETGFHSTDDTWETILEVLLAVMMGGAVGWVMTHQKRPALALAVASLGLALAQGGPIPVTNSIRAARLMAAVSLLYPFCGLALALLVSVRTRCRRGSNDEMRQTSHG